MAIYRYCVCDGGNRVRETQERNFAHDKQAMDNTAVIIGVRDGERIEIWQGTRLVQSYERPKIQLR